MCRDFDAGSQSLVGGLPAQCKLLKERAPLVNLGCSLRFINCTQFRIGGKRFGACVKWAQPRNILMAPIA